MACNMEPQSENDVHSILHAMIARNDPPPDRQIGPSHQAGIEPEMALPTV